MIAVVVSMKNGCLYCLVAHGAALREALGDPILADRITLDHHRAGLDERRTAILTSPRRSPRGPWSAPQETSNASRASGSLKRKSGTWSRSLACTTSPTACRSLAA